MFLIWRTCTATSFLLTRVIKKPTSSEGSLATVIFTLDREYKCQSVCFMRKKHLYSRPILLPAVRSILEDTIVSVSVVCCVSV